MTVLQAIFPSRTGLDVRRRLMTVSFFQKTAVDDTFLIDADKSIIPMPCRVEAAGAWILGALPAAGESMAIDLKKNGVSFLSAKLTLSNGSPAAVRTEVPFTTISATLALSTFAIGDVLSGDYDYTAGGGATPMTGVLVKVLLNPFYNA